jgi:lipoprotein-anchoring transpeptidase ErfK/SrfK
MTEDIKGNPMDQNNEARELIAKAREALRRGDKESAWKLGEQAALSAPDLEDAWLILAASDPDPQDALAYAEKALEVNPASTRARKAIDWAKAQVRTVEPVSDDPLSDLREASVAPVETPVEPAAPPPPVRKSRSRTWIFAAAILGLLLCVLLVFFAYTAVTHPAFASILERVALPTQESLAAPVEIAKSSATPVEAGSLAQDAVATPTARPTEKPPTSLPSAIPTLEATEAPSEAASPTPQATETPGQLVMEAVEDTPTSEYVAPSSSAPLPEIALSGNGERWIDVDLTNQYVYAYEGDVVVNSFIVSTGTWRTPTVTGQYKIYVKYRSAKMSGPGYYLPNVPYIMYFYKGYGLHGTYWHNNFGTPMSHGCVNLRTDDAAWLYEWASVGTLVNVHY